jgi:hypothetical protein
MVESTTLLARLTDTSVTPCDLDKVEQNPQSCIGFGVSTKGVTSRIIMPS